MPFFFCRIYLLVFLALAFVIALYTSYILYNQKVYHYRPLGIHFLTHDAIPGLMLSLTMAAPALCLTNDRARYDKVNR